MAKYKNLTPKLIEGFLDKMFGRIATKTGQAVARDMSRSDPEIGKLLTHAANLVKKTEKHLNSMSKSDRAKYIRNLKKKHGIK